MLMYNNFHSNGQFIVLFIVNPFTFIIVETFPKRSRLRGGVYFVDSLEKNLNGKLMRKTVTEMATALFKAAKNNDPDIQSYLQDIPEEFRKMI